MVKSLFKSLHNRHTQTDGQLERQNLDNTSVVTPYRKPNLSLSCFSSVLPQMIIPHTNQYCFFTSSSFKLNTSKRNKINYMELSPQNLQSKFLRNVQWRQNKVKTCEVAKKITQRLNKIFSGRQPRQGAAYFRNVATPLHLDAAECLRRLYWILWRRKLQNTYNEQAVNHDYSSVLESYSSFFISPQRCGNERQLSTILRSFNDVCVFRLQLLCNVTVSDAEITYRQTSFSGY